jgi:MoaA/NifB/PqqE/SkfB family radical SAM enzyme
MAYHLGGRIRPVLAGYKITHRCNLTCLHCPYRLRSGAEPNFSLVLETLEKLRSMGARILILEGGEPLLWRDGERTIRDVVRAARGLFPSVCITTNGTIPWGDVPADRVWVSLDGPPEIHDRIRGKGAFSRVTANIDECGNGRTLVSTTLNRINCRSVAELLSLLRGRVEGATIQFHYPYQGLPDPLFISPEERGPILDELMLLKSRGYPVANSFACLRDMKNECWSCEAGFLANAEPDGSVFHGCYLKNRGESICSECGFTAHNEMTLAFKGRMESILTGLRIFFGGN